MPDPTRENLSTPLRENEKQIREYFDQEAIRLNSSVAKFGGFYNRDNNSRAESRQKDGIFYNEKYFGANYCEIQRVTSHEIQHLKNYEAGGNDENMANYYLFELHPEFKPVYDRMKQYYEEQKGAGYPFAKEVMILSWDNVTSADSSLNYIWYDELLSLLRGYEIYTKQEKYYKEQGMSEDEMKKILSPQPYEFIEAFRIEDLRFLDAGVREKLAKDVLDSQSDIATKEAEKGKLGTGFKITVEDIEQDEANQKLNVK